MNSSRNFILFSLIISLLLIPLIPNQKIGASYIIGEVELIESENTEDQLPKLLPLPPSNGTHTEDYFNSIGIEFAEPMFIELSNIFPYTSIPNNRIWDLTAVQHALTCVDMFFVTGHPEYLTEGDQSALSLRLDVNDSYIVGEDVGSFYELNADENLMLVIMYNRLAQGFQVDGDVGKANVLRDLANRLFANLTSLFYHIPSSSVNSTLFLSKSQFEVIGTSQGASARSTGLYLMANYLSNNTGSFYTQAKEAVDSYRINFNQSFSLPNGDHGFIYRSSNELASAGYNEADLRGNIYMNTALMQISKYEEDQGNPTVSFDYFNWTDMGEAMMKELFKSSTTLLLHTKYDLTTTTLAETALTYENCLYLSHSIEFKRLKKEKTGITPSFIEINDLFNELYFKTFIVPDFFTAGYTNSGFQLDLASNIPHSSPHIVNFQAITMLLKFYPLYTMLIRPTDLIPNLPMLIDWFLDIPETSSIFKASNQTFSFKFEFELNSETIDFITYPPTKRFNTTSLDGIILQSSQKATINLTSSVGGEHFVLFQLKSNNFIVLDFDQYFLFKKLIKITTDSNLEITQFVDTELALNILCEDECASPILGANVDVALGSGLHLSDFTDGSGYVDIYIPIEEFNYAKPDPSEGDIPSFTTTITITVTKAGHLRKEIIKDVTIRMNELVLDLNPAPEGKEGSDLTIYLDVETRIEATLYNVEVVNITIDSSTGSEKFKDDEDRETGWELPATIIIGKEYLVPNERVNVTLTIDVPGGSIHILSFSVFTEPLQFLERIYYWLEIAFSSDIVKVIGSLSIVWALLWRQFSLRIIKRIRRCPYCGDTTKTKYAYCKNCGLKDMTLNYKKAVDSSKKEPRILRNEKAFQSEALEPEKPSYKEEVYQSQSQPQLEYDRQEENKDDSTDVKDDDYQF